LTKIPTLSLPGCEAILGGVDCRMIVPVVDMFVCFHCP
jgi:hypothetical protein